MRYYCPNCKKECETKVVEQDETLNVKGREITLKVKMRICNECGEGIIDKELDNTSLKAFYAVKAMDKSITAIKDLFKWIDQVAAKYGDGEKALIKYIPCRELEKGAELIKACIEAEEERKGAQS